VRKVLYIASAKELMMIEDDFDGFTFTLQVASKNDVVLCAVCENFA
jgi:hypothetical protein